MIVLTAYGTSLSNIFLGDGEKVKNYSLGKCWIGASSRKGHFRNVWGGRSLEQFWVIFQDFIFSLMSTGNLQIDGQFEKGDVGDEIDTVERSRASWSPPWSFRVFTQEIPSLRSLPCPRDAGFPSSHSHRSWGVRTSERSGCQQRLFHLEDSVNNCSYIC